MSKPAYYNEFNKEAAAWLRELIKAGHIADGDVDERSIEDVLPSELRAYTQCHFFAGIGVWSYALRQAGWSDDRPVWTGSCPCQPFSSAGKGAAFTDERHLWPAFHHLIEQRRPPVIFGEQVASKYGLAWIDLVHADLEGTGYAVGAVDTCSAGVGAPHIRQRLYWVADDDGQRCGEARSTGGRPEKRFSDGGAIIRFGDDDAGLEGLGSGHQAESGRDGAVRPVAEAGEFGGLANTDMPIPEQLAGERARPGEARGAEPHGQPNGRSELAQGQPPTGPTNGHWRDADWLYCRDGKWRPVEPGTFPLAHGATARVGRLRGYGNAINAEAAKAFIESFMEARA